MSNVLTDSQARKNIARNILYCIKERGITQSELARHSDHRKLSRAEDGMKVGEVLKLLKDDGWQLVVTRGSHRQLKHVAKPGRVTVAGKASDDLTAGTLNSILKQAGLKK